LEDVEAPTFSSTSANRRQQVCQPYALAALYYAGRILVLISVTVNPKAIICLEGLGQLKNPITSPETKTTSFHNHNQLHYNKANMVNTTNSTSS
jgi:hypothetical protein